MYVLLHEDSKTFIGIYDTKVKAFVVARVTSRERSHPIVCIYNRPLGGTSVCFKFDLGEQTFDGGCCPPVWSPPEAPESAVTGS